MNKKKELYQKTFDTVWNGINAQGGPSVEYPGVCMYRGQNGRKCAVGFLIPDDKYDIYLEGCSVGELRERFASTQELWDLPEAFLNRLRRAHDQAELNTTNDEQFMAVWKTTMHSIAACYCLEVPEEESK